MSKKLHYRLCGTKLLFRDDNSGRQIGGWICSAIMGKSNNSQNEKCVIIRIPNVNVNGTFDPSTNRRLNTVSRKTQNTQYIPTDQDAFSPAIKSLINNSILSEVNNPWISLSSFSMKERTTCNPFRIVFSEKTNNLYAFFLRNDRGSEVQLMQYSFGLDSWREIKVNPPIKLSGRGFVCSPWFATMDCDNNAIIVWFHGKYLKLWKLAKLHLFVNADGTTYAVYENVNISHLSEAARKPFSLMDCEARGIIIGSQLHFIVRDGQFEHLIYDTTTLHLQSRGVMQFWPQKMTDTYAVAKVADRLLVFGWGSCQNKHLKYAYDTATGYWRRLKGEIHVSPGASREMGCTVTPILNETHLLLIGWGKMTKNKDYGSIQIEVHSLIDQCIIKRIKFPTADPQYIIEAGNWHAFTVQDKGRPRDVMTVHGYFRQCWKLCGIADHLFPPPYIIDFVQMWYWTDVIHIFAHFDRRDMRLMHWAIDAVDITGLDDLSSQ